MRTFRHLTPRYVVDRLVGLGHERLHPDWPWIVPAMVEVLQGWLRPGDRGLEWGSGRSTAWLAQRVAHVTSIEENSAWGAKVEEMLRARGLQDRVALHVTPVDAARDEQVSSARYVRVADTITPASLDFCLVDGAVRDQCAWAALPLLRAGGILVIDNIECYMPRPDKSRAPNARGTADGFELPLWQRVAGELADWRRIWMTSGTTDTALWVKPPIAGGPTGH